MKFEGIGPVELKVRVFCNKTRIYIIIIFSDANFGFHLKRGPCYKAVTWLPCTCVHVFILIQSYMFTFLTGVPHWKMVLFMDIVYFLLSYIILSCKIVDSDWLRVNITRWIRKPRPNTWWNLATGDIAWRRVIFQKYDHFLR